MSASKKRAPSTTTKRAAKKQPAKPVDPRKQPAPKIDDTLAVAKYATAIFTRNNTVSRGAKISATHVKIALAVLAKKPFARKSILQSMHVTEKQLTLLSDNRMTIHEPSDDAQIAMKTYKSMFAVESARVHIVDKMFPTKHYALLYAIYRCKKRSAAPSKPKPAPTPTPASTDQP